MKMGGGSKGSVEVATGRTMVLLGIRVEVRRVEWVPDSRDVRRFELFVVELVPRVALRVREPRVVHDVVHGAAQVPCEVARQGSEALFARGQTDTCIKKVLRRTLAHLIGRPGSGSGVS